MCMEVMLCTWQHRGAGDHLGLVSYTEGVENKADKANLEQCNLKLNYRDANDALLSFPPQSDCVSLFRPFNPAPGSGPSPPVQFPGPRSHHAFAIRLITMTTHWNAAYLLPLWLGNRCSCCACV